MGEYSSDKQIRFKTTMLRLSLCDYSVAYILVKGTITVNNMRLKVLLQIILIKK